MIRGHHVVYQQHVRQLGGDLSDPRNFMPVEDEEHERHHKRTEPFSVSRLPNEAFEYAAELLGPERAFNYLRRRYQGDDPRLDALIAPKTDDLPRDENGNYGTTHGRRNTVLRPGDPEYERIFGA